MSTPSALDAMLKQYENNANSFTKSSSTEKFDLKNYFTTHLSEKEKSATKNIRILPTNDGTTPFVEIYGHKAQVDGEKKTFVCLKHLKNEDCPFCEAREALLATGKEADKELAKKYSARKMYVVKIIDRDDEAHGPKFWRFMHDYRKQGIFDKIFGVLQAVKKDITDPTTGRDLQILLARDQNNYPIVQSILHMDATPLSADAEIAKNWLADSKTWEDVYAVKPYEFLEIIVKGGVPVFDKEAKKFVDKASISEKTPDKLDQELSLGVQNVKNNVTTSSAAPITSTVLVNETVGVDVDDDLPF